MGRRELQLAMADRALWSDAALCGCRLLHSYEGTDRASRSLLTAGDLHPIRWVGENYNSPWPIALYGLMLLFAGVAYFILTKALIAHHGASSRLATSIRSDGSARITTRHGRSRSMV